MNSTGSVGGEVVVGEVVVVGGVLKGTVIVATNSTHDLVQSLDLTNDKNPVYP